MQRVWNEICDCMTKVRHYLPEYDPRFMRVRVGNFSCLREQLGSFGLTVLKESDENFFTNICWMSEHSFSLHPFLETWMKQERRRVMVTYNMIFAQPSFWDGKASYPIFHEYWKRGKDRRGTLVFFRVDTSLNDFAYYTRKSGFRAEKRGDASKCASFPDSIRNVEEVFDRKIARSIDFEEKSQKIFKHSLLQEFTAVCKKAFLLINII